MNEQNSFRRIAAISTIIAGLLILASIIVLSMAVDFNVEFLDNPAGLITAGLGASAVGLFRWGSILELFGYFLLLIPAALYLWYWLSPHSSGLVTLYTVLGLAGILIGVVEEAIRASFFPSMMLAYPQAAEAQRAVLEAIFGAVVDFNFENLYALNSILAGVWWLGTGLVLRGERRSLGVATALLGTAALGAGVGWLLRIDLLARLEMLYVFEPFWALWLGVVIWRRADEPGQLREATMGG
jgi:hypothetical protein